MRIVPGNLEAKLDSGVTTLAQAWRLTRADGLIIGVTQHDRDLFFDDMHFVAAHSFIGGDNERDVTLSPNRSALSGALTIGAITQSDLALGRWDHAKVQAFWVDWTNPSDFIPMWSGVVVGANWRGSVFELDIAGPQVVLNREIGRVYSRSCDAALGDARCQVDLDSAGRTLNAVVADVVSDRTILIALPVGKTSDDFVGGVLVVLSGTAREWKSDVLGIVVSASNWVVSLSRPFAIPLPIGDSVSISMGCDKSFAICKARFANGLNFRGQPTLPGEDVAFGGPTVTGNDGGKR